MTQSGEEVSSRELVVSVYDRQYRRVGQVPDFVSCSVAWQWLGVGTGSLTVEEDDPVASYLLGADDGVVPVIVNIGDVRWSGRVAESTFEREGPPGSGTVTATLVDDWAWLRTMLASQNGSSTALPTTKATWAATKILDRMAQSDTPKIGADWTWENAPEEVVTHAPALIALYGGSTTDLTASKAWLTSYIASTSMPKFDTRTGKLATIAAGYINDAATRLAAPVVAIVPVPDTSPTVTLNARMTTLADLLTDALRASGVRLTVTMWLPGDPNPSGLPEPLSTPTVVMRLDVPPAKPWLRWSDTVGGLVRASVTTTTPQAYHVILGLEGQDELRVYDQYLDSAAKSVAGPYGLPEAYVDATDVERGADSQAAGARAVRDLTTLVSLEAEVADGEPWAFGRDYDVGDTGTVELAGVGFTERVTMVTVSEDRDNGLSFTPVVGENAKTGDSSDLMIRAMGMIARQLRTVQSGR